MACHTSLTTQLLGPSGATAESINRLSIHTPAVLTEMGLSFAIATGGVLTLSIAAPPNGSSF